MNFTSDSDGRKKTFNEINITPLTDIFLVLLIIMMVIAPSFQSVDNKIKMPEINSGLAVETKDVIIAITKEGNFYLNNKPISCADLTSHLSSIVGKLEKKEILVRADKETKSAQIMKVMQVAQDVGFEKLVVAGEPLSKKEQKELKKKSDIEQNNINTAQEEIDEPIARTVRVPSERQS